MGLGGGGGGGWGGGFGLMLVVRGVRWADVDYGGDRVVEGLVWLEWGDG